VYHILNNVGLLYIFGYYTISVHICLPKLDIADLDSKVFNPTIS